MAGIDIPDNWMGKPIDGALERVLAKKQTPVVPAPIVSPVTANIINPRTYLKVPQYGNTLIATEETHRGKDMYETLQALKAEGLVMPSPRLFMTHWINVKQAAVNKLNALVYADGTTVPDTEAERLWAYLSSTDRKPFGNKPAWSWLNARFTEENGKWYMQNDLQVVTDSTGKKKLEGIIKDLDCPIREDCYVDLEFNAQGFPIRESTNQQYEQGNNSRFWHPRNEAVAGFNAGSVWAGLNCNGDPTNRNSSLGVFVCAEGAEPIQDIS